MTGINWEDGFQAGWESCEKRYMKERETMLAERNAARNEVERLKTELSGLKKIVKDRKDVLDAITVDDETKSRRELKRRADEALKDREVLIAERNAARSEVSRLKDELKVYEDEAERREAVLDSIKAS